MSTLSSTPLVSIIIPIYNAGNYLSQCMDSLLAQTYKNLEIILVDDGSTDTSPDLCDSYAQQDSRIRVIHQSNSGAMIARETGIFHAHGQYLMFIDSDDWIDPATISYCINFASQNDSDCVMFGYVREYPNRSIQTPLFNHDFSYDKELSEKQIHRRLIGLIGSELQNPQSIDRLSSVCMKLYSAPIARQGRIVSERIVGTSEDTLFNLYALENCRIGYINQCFYHYRKSNTQSITTQYKADLSNKWDIMYNIMEEYIRGSNPEEYRTPFLNRVACGTIGLGLNEASSSASISQKAARLRHILKKPLYTHAFSQFDISHCPLKWKLFFLLCQQKTTFPLVVLLQIMNKLRAHNAS